VRVFDAATFDNGVTVNASLTANTIGKYQDLVDDARDHSLDDVSFTYSSGDGADSINLQIDGDVAASNSNIVVGRHDFTIGVDAGEGNDTITVAMVDGLGGTNWYTNQQINDNVTVDGGTGDDVIMTPGAGNVTINAGAGADAVYADNTGAQAGVDYNAGRATWLFNNANADINDTVGAAAVADATNVVNLDLTVTYAGYSVTVEIAGDSGTTVNDLTINQAIKDAINNDEHLSHILVAEDHAGRSLQVRALQDDVDAAGNLDLTLVNGGVTVAQTTAGWAALSDAQAAALGFQANSGGDGAAGTHGNDGGATRFDSELAQDTQTVDLTLTTTTEGAIAAQEVQVVNLTNVATIANGATDTITEDGTLVISVGTSVYSVDVDAADTMTSVVTALNALGDNTVIFSEGADGGAGALDTLILTFNSNGNKSISEASFTYDAEDLVGANSTVVSDNVITGAAGDDTIILGSMGDGTGADGQNIAVATARVDDVNSNDIVVYSAAWGADAIVHFQVDADVTTLEVSNGTDFIDLTAFVDGYDAGVGGAAGDFAEDTTASNGATVVDANDTITIEGSSATNDTTAEILAFYNDGVAGAAGVVAGHDENHIYIRVDAANTTGTVFHITDGDAAEDATIVELGSISLIDSSNTFANITADNFVIA